MPAADPNHKRRVTQFIAKLKTQGLEACNLPSVSSVLQRYPLFESLLFAAIMDFDDPLDVDQPSDHHCKLLSELAETFRLNLLRFPQGVVDEMTQATDQLLATGFPEHLIKSGFKRGELSVFVGPRPSLHKSAIERLAEAGYFKGEDKKNIKINLETRSPSSKSIKIFDHELPSMKDLIEHFDKNPHLWDKNHPDYGKGPQARDYITLAVAQAPFDRLDSVVAACREVCEKYNISLVTAKAKFCQLCDRTAEQGVCDGCENSLFMPGPSVPLEPVITLVPPPEEKKTLQIKSLKTRQGSENYVFDLKGFNNKP